MPTLTIAKLVGLALLATAVIGGLWWVYNRVELSYSELSTIAADNNAINDLKGQVQTAVGVANSNEQKYEAEVQTKTKAEAVMQETTQKAAQLATDNETLKEKVHDTKSSCVDPKLDVFLDSMRVRDANRKSAASQSGGKSVVSGRSIPVQLATTPVAASQ